ncbi:MAG: methyltransferase [uncultured bacterium]|nr:MAG: methyltransferase [uncultured bacterium]
MPEVYDFVESCQLKLIEFTGFHIDDINARELYTPSFYLKSNPVFLEKISKLPKKDQQAIAELMVGSRSQHAFYVAKNENTKASLDDLNNIPYFVRQMTGLHNQIANNILSNPNTFVKLSFRLNTSVTFKPGIYTASILKYMDGAQTLESIFEKVRNECSNNKPSIPELLADFKPVFEAFELLDLILLRNNNVPEFYSLKRFPI